MSFIKAISSCRAEKRKYGWSAAWLLVKSQRAQTLEPSVGSVPLRRRLLVLFQTLGRSLKVRALAGSCGNLAFQPLATNKKLIIDFSRHKCSWFLMSILLLHCSPGWKVKTWKWSQFRIASHYSVSTGQFVGISGSVKQNCESW